MYYPEVSAVWMPQDGISFEEWKKARFCMDHPEEATIPQEPVKEVRYFVGCDLGKLHDPSTVAVVEVLYTPVGVAHYYIKHLKKFALRMLCSNVAIALAKIDKQLQAHAAKQGKEAVITWVLDVTGVGESVAELVEKAMPYADIVKCYVTGGIEAKIDYDQRSVHLPKGQMVSALIAAFDSKRLYLTKRSREFAAMLDELQNYEIRLSENTGREQFGAFKDSASDDLVTAVGLAVWAAEQQSFEPFRLW